jgi:hypothetical protein
MLRRSLTVTALAIGVLAACGGDDRPTATSWRGVWESRQALVPTADAISDGGQDLCGERLGLFRAEMPKLLPTPAEELDSAVGEWVSHAETMVFECPTDPADLAERFEILDVLAAEVDAGLIAEAAG